MTQKRKKIDLIHTKRVFKKTKVTQLFKPNNY